MMEWNKESTQIDSTITAIDFSNRDIHSYSCSTNKVKNCWVLTSVINPPAEETLLSAFLALILMDILRSVKSRGRK